MGTLKADTKIIQKYIDATHINSKELIQVKEKSAFANLPNKVKEIEA